MKYILMIVLTILILLSVMNIIEIRKLRALKKQKQVLLKFIDQYLKLYWDSLPEFLKECKKSKHQDKKIIEKLLLERNHIYDRMNFEEKLIRHVKIEEMIESIEDKIIKEKNSVLTKNYQKLKGIEKQIVTISKEFEVLLKEISKIESNPFVKIILIFIKV